MDWLKSIAPLIGTALGGPLGGAAVSFIADKLGVSGATVQNVTEALQSGKMSPEQITAIKEAEIDFQKFLITNKIDLEKVAAADRANAREMQDQTHSNMPAILTVMITVGFFGVLGWMLCDESVIDAPPLLIMLGSLGTAWTGCCAFWFGTTSSSGKKDVLLANSIPAK